MKAMKRNILYLVIGIWCIGFTACTHDSEEPKPVLKNELSRSTITIERTVTLTTPGTLQEQVEAAMAGEDVSTLQKLTIVGPYNGSDVQYWKEALANIIEFDLKDAVPTETEDDITIIDEWGNNCWQSNNEIMVYSFSEMTSLEKIIFPSCVTYICRFACRGCTNLVDVEFPLSLNGIDCYAFENCGFTSIEIPSSVINFSYNIFCNNTKLKSAKFQEGIIRIPEGIFSNCTALETVELSSTVEEVGSSAFAECISLKSFPFSHITKINTDSFNRSGFEEVDLSNVTDLSNASSSFAYCESLKKVILPSNVTSLPDYMFYGCKNLKEINFPSLLETIGFRSFRECGFSELTIPSSVKYICDGAFMYNDSLTSITLSEGLETIGENAFRRAGIESFNIPSTVTSLGYCAIGETKIKSLHVPATVETVGDELVWGCHNLQYIKWDSQAELLDCDNVNTNCYVYLANENIGCGPNWNNVIIKINGEYVAESVTLCEGGQRDNSNWSYSVPIAFKAKKIKYERRFGDYDWQGEYWTHPGECSGWQTIVLPFTPTEIKHETKGEVAPFNHPYISEKDAKPFWLRELTANGWEDVITMEANKPYIIAMPNHDSYWDAYRLYGKITFSAKDVTLIATSDGNSEAVYPASVGPEYDLQPTYHFVERSPMVYVLNTTSWIEGCHYGSVFAKESSDVYAFEAFVSVAGRLARSTFDIDTSSSNTRSAKEKNTTGIPQIGDM